MCQPGDSPQWQVSKETARTVMAGRKGVPTSWLPMDCLISFTPLSYKGIFPSDTVKKQAQGRLEGHVRL